MKWFARTGAGVAALLGVAGGLCAPANAASPLDRGWIQGDATWLVHVDVERLVATDLGRMIIREIERAEVAEGDDVDVNIRIRAGEVEREVEVEAHADAEEAEVKVGLVAPQAMAIEALMPQSLREFREKYQFDPFSDVLSITVFGDNAKEAPDTVLVHTTAAIDNAVREIEKVEGLNISHLDGTTVARFTPAEQDAEPTFVAVRPEPDGTRMMFFASSLDELASVMAPMGNGEGPEWALPAPDAFIYIRAIEGSPLLVEAGRSQMLRDAESIELNIGQRGQEMFVQGRLETGADEVATNMAQVGNGLLALVRLGSMSSEMAPEERAAIDLIRNLTIKSDGPTVRLDMSFESAKLIKLMESELD